MVKAVAAAVVPTNLRREIFPDVFIGVGCVDLPTKDI
jgi:hypothetical protein